MCVLQNWPNLEKCPPFFQFYQNILNIFLVKDLTNRVFFHKLKAFASILFWLGCDVWKMDDLFQRLLGSISIILNFSKKNLVKTDIKQLSPKKIEKFWWKLKEYKPYLYPVGHFGHPPKPPLGLIWLPLIKSCHKLKAAIIEKSTLH